jgi:SAM-dependent methyltransferase
MDTVSKWPKAQVELTPEQDAAWEAFFTLWHEVLPRRYRMIERFNHSFPMRYSHKGARETLEIGAGSGGHLAHQQLSPDQARRYHAVELRESMAAQLREKHPGVNVLVADCQRRMPYEDGRFDRCIAVHVLEHLPDLPACLAEVWRLLDKQHGQLLAVIPCEGRPAYTLARRLSAKRIFEDAYGMPYEPMIKREHLNRPEEIIAELDRYFIIEHRRYFPLTFVPASFINLVIGLALRPRPVPLGS